MKLLVAVVILSLCSSSLALENESRNRRSLSNVFHYFTDIDIKSNTDFNFHMMNYQHFISWMDNLIIGLKGIIGEKYKPSNDEVVHIVGCYFRRYWERKQTADLTKDERFCKRVSENKPNDAERRDLHRFGALLKMWESMNEVDKIQFGRYTPTDGEKEEIEDCFFFRSWAHKATLTKHESFCQRLSDNKPNQIETLEKTAFEAYREEWANMTQVAVKDFAQITLCTLVERKFVKEPRERPCKNYFKLVLSPNSWREIRKEEVHRCMRQSLRNKRTKQCTDTVKHYKEVYCQNSC